MRRPATLGVAAVLAVGCGGPPATPPAAGPAQAPAAEAPKADPNFGRWSFDRVDAPPRNYGYSEEPPPRPAPVPAAAPAAAYEPPPRPPEPPDVVTRRDAEARKLVDRLGGKVKTPAEGRVDVDLFDSWQLEDAHLAVVKHVRGLTHLDLSKTRVTDAGLANLADLDRLVGLYLSHTRVSSDGLKHLAGMHRLEVLNLARTAVTSEGVGHLAGLGRLHTLTLDATEVGGGVMPALHRLRSLRTLGLYGCDVRDDWFEGADAFPNLDYVSLTGRRLTPRVLDHLGRCKTLRHVSFGSVGLPPEIKRDDVDEFRRRHPGVRVYPETDPATDDDEPPG